MSHIRFLSLLLLTCPPAAAQLNVTAVSPGRHVNGVSPAARITMTCSQAVDPATVTSRSFTVFGRFSGPVPGTLSLVNGGTTIQFDASRPLFAGEMVMVNASSAIAAPGGSPRLLRGHAWWFWTRSAPGSDTFTLANTFNARRTGEGLVQTYGANGVDLDRDGSPDLSITCEVSNDLRVVRNDGCGSYSGMALSPLQPNSTPSPNEAADFDGDGWADLVVANTTASSVSVFLNNQAGGYRAPVHYAVGSDPRAVTVLDAEGDGDSDIVTANQGTSNLSLLRNQGNGTFAAATFFEGGATGERTVAAGDANEDGVMDLLVGHFSSQTMTVLLGNGDGTFTWSASQPSLGTPWMMAIGDLNNDGHVDLITANSSNARMMVMLGNGTGGISAGTTYSVGSFPLAADLGDLDGDGDLDAVVANYGGVSFSIWRNLGAGVFGGRTTLPAAQAGSCALLVDYDRDGDLDIIGIDERSDDLFFFRQSGNAPAGVQAPTCAATLRVDQWAGRAGYGTAAPRAVPAGGRFFLGHTGSAGSLVITFASDRLEPGVATGFGLLNLDPLILLFLDDATLDPFGEATTAIPVPAGTSPGLTLALQALVLPAPFVTGTLTNPERIVVQ
jgi:hypothetical protein